MLLTFVYGPLALGFRAGKMTQMIKDALVHKFKHDRSALCTPVKSQIMMSLHGSVAQHLGGFTEGLIQLSSHQPPSRFSTKTCLKG